MFLGLRKFSARHYEIGVLESLTPGSKPAFLARADDAVEALRSLSEFVQIMRDGEYEGLVVSGYLQGPSDNLVRVSPLVVDKNGELYRLRWVTSVLHENCDPDALFEHIQKLQYVNGELYSIRVEVHGID